MFSNLKNHTIFALPKGEMAEWSNAAVLKTVEGHTSGGSNPSFSAVEVNPLKIKGFISKSKQMAVLRTYLIFKNEVQSITLLH